MAKKKESKGSAESAASLLDLAPRLKERGLEPLYLLEGPENYLRDRALEDLRRFAAERGGTADLGDFEGEKAELAQILDEVRTLPLLGGCRLVHVRDAEGLLARFAEEFEAFLDELAKRKGEARSALVLSSQKLDGRLRISKRVRESAVFVACETPDRIGLLRFVRDRARAAGRELAPGADAALLDRYAGGAGVAADMGLLEREVAKLCAAAQGKPGEAAPIGLDDVNALASWMTAEDTFAVVGAVGRGDVRGALEALRSVLRDGAIVDGDRKREPKALAPILLGLLAWDTTRIFRARALLDAGRSLQEVVAEARAWRERDVFLARVRGTSEDALRRRHALLREADAQVKESGDPVEILTALIARLALEAREAAPRHAFAGR